MGGGGRGGRGGRERVPCSRRFAQQYEKQHPAERSDITSERN